VDSTPPVYYGLDGAEEAAAYLRDDVLGDRLVTAAGVVREHVTRPRPPRLDVLMGSPTDAVKLVSCMTLFEHVAKRVSPADPQPRFAAMGAHVGASYPRCGFTERSIADPRER